MRGSQFTDVQGLDMAYAHYDNVVVSGQTMYISGTHPNASNRTSDYMTDLAIPLHLLATTHRYKQAAYHLSLHPEVKTLVGHSLGGAIAQELAAANGMHARVYGAPTLFGRDGVEYYRHTGDPVSVTNWVGALFGHSPHSTARLGNPHSFH